MSTGRHRVITRRLRGLFHEYDYWMRRARQAKHSEQRQRLKSQALQYLDQYFELEDELFKPRSS